MNILKQISESVNDISERQYNRIKSKFTERKVESEYWEQLKKDADCWAKFINNPEYPVIKRLFSESIKQLNGILKAILSGNFKDYTREERADKAAILMAQISILEMLSSEPERVIEEIRKSKREVKQ